MRRKRAPGAGRPIQEGARKSKAVIVRITPELWAKLEAARNESGRLYMSEEVTDRLKKSLDDGGRPDVQDFLELISRVMRRVERVTGKRWREDAFTSATIRHGTEMLLFHFGAQGAMVVPPNIKKLAERLPDDYSKKFQTPKELGTTEAGRVIAEIEMEGLLDFEEDKKTIRMLQKERKLLQKERKPAWVELGRARNVSIYRRIKATPGAS